MHTLKLIILIIVATVIGFALVGTWSLLGKYNPILGLVIFLILLLVFLEAMSKFGHRFMDSDFLEDNKGNRDTSVDISEYLAKSNYDPQKAINRQNEIEHISRANGISLNDAAEIYRDNHSSY